MDERKIISALVAWFPLLGTIRSPVPGVDLATFLTILVFALIVSSDRECTVRQPYGRGMLLLSGYVTVVTVLGRTLGEPTGGNVYPEVRLVFFRMAKFVLVIAVFFLLGMLDRLDTHTAVQDMRVLIYGNTCFITIQRLAYHGFHKILLNPLVFTAVNDLYNPSTYKMVDGTVFRPSGFFLEPSHVAQYSFVLLCYCLFAEKPFSSRIPDLLVVSLGILCSASSMGILVLAGLLSVTVLLRTVRHLFQGMILAAGFGVLVWLLWTKTQLIQLTMRRVFGSGENMVGVAVTARFEGYAFLNQLTPMQKLVGCGFGNVPVGVYLNGAAYILFTLGIVGMLLFLWIWGFTFWQARAWGRWLMLVFLGLILGAQMFTAVSAVYYFGIVRMDSKMDAYTHEECELEQTFWGGVPSLTGAFRKTATVFLNAIRDQIWRKVRFDLPDLAVCYGK